MSSICHFFLSPWLLPAWAFGATWRLFPATSPSTICQSWWHCSPKASFLLSPAGVRRSSSRGFLPCHRKRFFSGRAISQSVEKHISRRKNLESIATVILSWWLMFLICFWFETSSIDSRPKKKWATPSESNTVRVYNLFKSFRSWTIGFFWLQLPFMFWSDLPPK